VSNEETSRHTKIQLFICICRCSGVVNLRRIFLTLIFRKYIDIEPLSNEATELYIKLRTSTSDCPQMEFNIVFHPAEASLREKLKNIVKQRMGRKKSGKENKMEKLADKQQMFASRTEFHMAVSVHHKSSSSFAY
jgi:hypothetical protein